MNAASGSSIIGQQARHGRLSEAAATVACLMGQQATSVQPSRRPTCFCAIQNHRLAAAVPCLRAAPVPQCRWGRMSTERTCHLPTSPPLPSRRGPCRASPKVGEGERHRAVADRGRGGAAHRQSGMERGTAAVPAGQAARRQGHRWWCEPAAAAIGRGGARSSTAGADVEAPVA
jgi:hypothetical protein